MILHISMLNAKIAQFAFKNFHFPNLQYKCDLKGNIDVFWDFLCFAFKIKTCQNVKNGVLFFFTSANIKKNIKKNTPQK